MCTSAGRPSLGPPDLARMHVKHDCIHDDLPRLASQRTPQRYVAPEKAATAAGSGTAQALRIHVSAQSLSSDPGRACFAAGESYSPFEGGSEYTCTSADVITAAKRTMLLEQLMPQATSAFSRLLRVQRLHGPLVLRNARCGYGGGVPVPEAHHTVGVDADFVVYLTARPIDVGGESRTRFPQPYALALALALALTSRSLTLSTRACA